MTEQDAWILLNAIPGIPPRTKHRLIAAFGGPQPVLTAPQDELSELVTERVASRIVAFREQYDPQTLRSQAASAGARILALSDPDYPAALRTIPDPPLALYLRGRIPPGVAVAVVGTRSPSHDGVEVAYRMARDLGASGVCVLSGLARGIDAAAHRGALEAGGVTLAVLGCGIDRVWPPEHVPLARSIEEQGGVLSEYPPGTPALRHHFPARNRILAGLAQAVVVVEARAQSGALITAEFALEFGREVFAVPGSVLNPRTQGTHQLLREGAHLATGAGDVLDRLGIPPRPRDVAFLDPEEQALFDLLEEPLDLDDLVRACGRSTPVVAAMLTALEVRGVVRRLPGGRYVRGRSC